MSDTPKRGLALLVEDDSALRTLLSLVLENQGFEVEAAVHGREALDKLRFKRPDVILTDLLMPTMNGWELMSALRADPSTRDIPIIVTSAHPRQNRADGLGVGAYLCKPFDLDDLFAVLNDVVGISRL